MTAPANVVIITTDQQRTDSLACYGSRFMRTSGFDHVARRGSRFTRAYCASAVCTPSRISLLSGQYVSRHGVWNVGVNAGGDHDLLSHRLARSGYQTCLIGKAHFEAYGADAAASRESVADFAQGYGDWTGPYYGFERVRLALGHSVYGLSGHYGAWLRDRILPASPAKYEAAALAGGEREFGGNAYDWDLPTALTNAVWTADAAIDFIELERDPGRPFFLSVNFQDPHHPHAVPRDFDDRVDPAAVPMPEVRQDALASMPPHFRLAYEGALKGSEFAQRWPVSGQHDGYDYRHLSAQSQRLARSYYYTLVQLVDRQLVRLWACLEAAGLDENTLVIVTSDHGELLGDHGLWMKGPFHYEQLVRVPLLMMGPGIGEGVVREDLVSLVDVVPTVLQWTGLGGLDAAMDGRDLMGPPRGADETVLSETILDWQGMICRSAIGGRHKMTCYAQAPYGELFDLAADPDEYHNLWDAAGSERLRSDLLSSMLDHDSRFMASDKRRIAYA